MASLTPDQYRELRQALPDPPIVPATFQHVSVRPGATVMRVGSTHISRLADVPLQVAGSRRIWIQTSSPLDPDRLLSPESHLGVRAWLDILHSDFPIHSLLRPPVLPCEAFADACADFQAIGLGGFIKLPSGIPIASSADSPARNLLLWCPGSTVTFHLNLS